VHTLGIVLCGPFRSSAECALLALVVVISRSVGRVLAVSGTFLVLHARGMFFTFAPGATSAGSFPLPSICPASK
jgi:hypothetical protein